MRRIVNIALTLSMLFIMNTNIKAESVKGSTFSHDPGTILKDGDTYWHFFTAPGIGAGYSKDLINWSSSGNDIFTPGANWKSNYPEWTIPYFGTGNNANTNGNLWAPDVIYMNGAYYLYYSCSSFGSSHSAIGVVKSPSLNNPAWVDMGKVVSSDSWTDINAIDPALFRDDDGKIYMLYGSWSGGIGIVDIDTVTGKATSSATKLYGGGGQANEAAAMFKKDNYYYLVVNRGTCCDGVNSSYYMVVGRSTNVKGPYTDFRTLLPNKDGKYIGPGHFALMQGECADYVSIHYYDKNRNGAATLDILKMKMVDGWPVLTRTFFFDNCNDDIMLDVGSGGEACTSTDFDFSNLSAEPSVYFYSSLYWDDNGAGGSFNDSSLLKPVYTPPVDYQGDVKITLNAYNSDSTEILSDSIALSLSGHDLEVEAGSDQEVTIGYNLNLGDATTPASANNYATLLWDDGGAGGRFSSTSSLKPYYQAPVDKADTITLTLTAFSDNHCYISDTRKIFVKEKVIGINGLLETDVKIYPNPNNGNFTIKLVNPSLDISTISIDVLSIDGRKVFSEQSLNSNGINVDSDLQPGIYMIHIQAENHVILQKKIIIK